MTLWGGREHSAAWWAGALLVSALLVWGGHSAWQWHTDPKVFPEAGNAWSGPLPEGREFMMIGITSSESGEGETVVVTSVAPQVHKNTAEASYEFYVCTADEEGAQVQLGMLSGEGSFDKYCPNSERVHEGTELRTGGTPVQQLVMVVRMGRPGVSSTTGVELTYTHGLQSGTQLIGPRVRVTTG